DPSGYRGYPFNDSLLTMAEDRQYQEIAQLLRDHLSQRFPIAPDIEPLLEAARKGDLARVEADLARNPALAHASNATGVTALHEAATVGHLPILRVLIDAGAPVDAVRGDGQRPVTCASRHRDRLRVGELVGYLLGRGAEYNIYLAAVLGDIQFVRAALARD